MSPMTTAAPALRTAWDEDAQGAAPPPSRYANYLADFDGPIREAVDEQSAAAWLRVIAKVARGPVMSQPPVRVVHPLVTTWSVELDQLEGGAGAQLTIATAPKLDGRLPSSVAGRSLHGWTYDTWTRGAREPDLDAEASFVASSVLRFPLDLTIASERMTAALAPELLAAARAALDDVVEQINAAAAPVLERIVSPVLLPDTAPSS